MKKLFIWMILVALFSAIPVLAQATASDAKNYFERNGIFIKFPDAHSNVRLNGKSAKSDVRRGNK